METSCRATIHAGRWSYLYGIDEAVTTVLGLDTLTCDISVANVCTFGI